MRLLFKLSLLVLVAGYLILPTSLTIGYVNYVDLLTSVVPNEPQVNTFYFWWVHALYLPYLFSSLFLIAAWWSNFRASYPIVAFLALAFQLWSVELTDLVYSNSQLTNLTTLSTTVNVLLSNALNKYHPFIFYSSTALVVSHALRSFLSLGGAHPTSTFRTLSWSSGGLLWVVWFNLFAIFLGSWWAMQEGTWGGWWNWDSSEMFGLLPSFLLLRLIHSVSSGYGCWRAASHYTSSLLILVFFYFLLQLNFDLISHNFGARFFHFFNSNLLFVSGIFILLLALTFSSVSFYSVSSCVTFFKNVLSSRELLIYFNRTYPPLLTYTLLSLWVLYSFFDFIEASKSVLLSFFTLVSRISFVDLNLLLLLTLSLYFLGGRGRGGLSPSVPSSAIPLSPSLFFELVGRGGTNWSLHLLITLFTLVTVLTNQIMIKSWLPLPQHSSIYLPEFSYWDAPKCYSLDAWSVEESSTVLHGEAARVVNWRRWDLSNWPQLDVFVLISSAHESGGSLLISGGYAISAISIHVLWLPTLFLLVVLTFLRVSPPLQFSLWDT